MSRSKKNIQPYWRPNFVNASDLPDIKVIRTGFIINFVALLLMLLTGFYVLQREYRAYTLNKTVDELEQRIRVADPEDAANIKLSNEFRDLASSISELELFYATPALAHVLVKELADLRPDELIYKRISFSESVFNIGKKNAVIYRINVAGEVRSLTVLDQFKGQLDGWDLLQFSGYELSIDEAVQGRDASTGIFPYTLEITLKPLVKKQEGGA